ncbi:Glyoxylate/hydroxypyruvate reductase A [Gossypium australe]|uniref:Glyoxylate/hydroxypyruvate reductase A n=1 Tax=Gossypium australe TaxID=47621 RepID=A0A5B6VMD8_9ROSI|nr:Glyoxylate/hydroxypyruvate reductase A [Gossypium australe]
MVGLHNVGTSNANTGFKAGYLLELERMMENFLPPAMLKAKPNLKSRIRTQKKDWAIIYDMLRGKYNSGFGLDKHRQMVIAEDE